MINGDDGNVIAREREIRVFEKIICGPFGRILVSGGHVARKQSRCSSRPYGFRLEFRGTRLVRAPSSRNEKFEDGASVDFWARGARAVAT